MTVPDWPIAFFDEEYLVRYRPLLTPERTAAEVEFIAQALDLPPGAKVLDLACGFGRHAVPMAERGLEVTGLDFQPAYLERAAESARKAGARVRFVAGDMRALPFENEFDAVYSWFTSFGYHSDEENERVIRGIAASLRPGGRLLMDLLNRDWMLIHGQQRTWTQNADGTLLMEEATLDLPNSRVTSQQTLITPGEPPRPAKTFHLRAYTCAELSSLMARHGLERRAVWGGADGSEFSKDSRRLILLAGKREEPR